MPNEVSAVGLKGKISIVIGAKISRRIK